MHAPVLRAGAVTHSNYTLCGLLAMCHSCHIATSWTDESNPGIVEPFAFCMLFFIAEGDWIILCQWTVAC